MPTFKGRPRESSWRHHRHLTFWTELYFTDTMGEVLGCVFFFFHTSNHIMKSGKTSFTVYSKVLLSSNKSLWEITENNEEKLELCAYWASSLQEICDKRGRGKSFCALCTSSQQESRKACLPNYRKSNTGVSVHFLTRNYFSLLFQWGQGVKGLTCKRSGTFSAPTKDRNQWNGPRVIAPTDQL